MGGRWGGVQESGAMGLVCSTISTQRKLEDKPVPLPDALSALMVPSWASTICLPKLFVLLNAFALGGPSPVGRSPLPRASSVLDISAGAP